MLSVLKAEIFESKFLQFTIQSGYFAKELNIYFFRYRKITISSLAYTYNIMYIFLLGLGVRMSNDKKTWFVCVELQFDCVLYLAMRRKICTCLVFYILFHKNSELRHPASTTYTCICGMDEPESAPKWQSLCSFVLYCKDNDLNTFRRIYQVNLMKLDSKVSFILNVKRRSSELYRLNPLTNSDTNKN